MDNLFNNLFDIFTREVVASYDLQTERRHRNSTIPEFSTNQSILNNARIIRQEFENRYRYSGSYPYSYPERLSVPLSQQRQVSDEASSTRYNTPNTPRPTALHYPLEDNEWISILTENLMSSFRDGMMNIIDNLENDLNLNFDFEDFEDVKVTLTESQFNNAVHTITNISDDDTCNICLDMLNNKEDNGIPVSLKCNHIFHNNCIKEWLTKKSIKCPMCRYECKRL
jgi:hypothetical protein